MTSYSKNIFLPILSLVVLLMTTSGANARVHDDYGKLYAALRAEEESHRTSTNQSLEDENTLQITPDSITAELADTLVAAPTSEKQEDVLDAPVSYQADDSLVWVVADAKAYRVLVRIMTATEWYSNQRVEKYIQ